MPYKIIIRCRAGHQRLMTEGDRMWYEDVYHNVWTETVDTETEALYRVQNIYKPSKEIERAWVEPKYDTVDEELAHALRYLLMTYEHLHKNYAELNGHPEWKCDNVDAVVHAREAIKRAKEEYIIHD